MKSIRILGKKYSFELVNDGDPALRGKDNVDACGRTYQIDCRLVVSKKQSKDQMDDTILHECLHAIDYSMQLGLSEEQVHRLACSITALLKDNPALAKQLLTN